MANTRSGVPSLKSKRGKKDIISYTIERTGKVVQAGDCVLMNSPDGKAPYVARIEKFETDSENELKVHVRWYYRPEDSLGGRREFHGAKEVFLSDHYDAQSPKTIEGKCTVHTYKKYTELKSVGANDYYCRFEYKATTGGFTPKRIAVYCKCEMPHNPDMLMVQCEECDDWFHPECVDMTIEEVHETEHYACPECSSNEGGQRSQNELASSPPSAPPSAPPRNRKARAKRSRR